MVHSMDGRHRKALRAAGVAAIYLAATAASVQAQEPVQPSPQAGLNLAQTLCQTCHLVASGDPGKPLTVGIPSFSFIANKPNQTGEAIERVLIAPHAPMPDLRLTMPEIQDIIAYLDTLRTDKSLPSLQPSNRPPDKVKTPTPS